jgi:hypothetical protein
MTAKVLVWGCYASRPRRFATRPLRSATPHEEGAGRALDAQSLADRMLKWDANGEF